MKFKNIIDNSAFFTFFILRMGFPSGSDGKESACNAGIQVRSLGSEDPLEK